MNSPKSHKLIRWAATGALLMSSTLAFAGGPIQKKAATEKANVEAVLVGEVTRI
jgi:hypothetical protein